MPISSEVWTIVESNKDAFKDISLQAISAAKTLAKDLGGSVISIVLTGNEDLDLEPLFQFGADKVLRLKHSKFNFYTVELALLVLVPLIQKRNPFAILIPSSIHGKELAGGLSAKINCPLATDCISLRKDKRGLIIRRPIYSGKVLTDVILIGEGPFILSLRANVFREEPSKGKKIKVEEIFTEVDSLPLTLKVRKVVDETNAVLDITEARIIVSGGMGMQTSQNFSILEELARVLGAAVGASRPVVDNGWRPYSNQVGQTGRTVSPDLYIACGISGSVQHIAGMSSSKCIVAINKDPYAPIFSLADYGIVGDAIEIIPMMTDEFKKLLGH